LSVWNASRPGSNPAPTTRQSPVREGDLDDEQANEFLLPKTWTLAGLSREDILGLISEQLKDFRLDVRAFLRGVGEDELEALVAVIEADEAAAEEERDERPGQRKKKRLRHWW